jgi:anti-sigma regulatory factor (Ser/Thr protein kinase)
MDNGLRLVQARACSAWPLPGDPTCAGIARRLFRRVAEGLALDQEAVDDGVMMVSELAANTLHAQQIHAAAANPELWLYLRGTGQGAELVCKVFDTLPGWVRGNVPGRAVRKAPPEAISGRGLEVVHELSGGRWGHHLSRARLSGAVAGLRGKAVWFSLPALPALPAVARPPGSADTSAGAAMTELERDLGNRGFAGAMMRADDPAADMAMLSISNGLTVWCRAAAAWLRTPGCPAQQWSYCDLTEVAEQAVQAYETLAATADPRQLADTPAS